MSTLNSRIAALLNGPLKGQGWCTPEKGHDLALAIIKTRASVSVEIGVFFGSSALCMALGHAEQKHGVLYAIDPWNSKDAAEGYDPVNAKWWSDVNHEHVYKTFLSHLKTQGVEEYVKVVRAKSDDFEPPPEIGVLHIDGSHTDQAIRDVERYAANVIPEGFCFCDDINWSSGGPARAVEKLLTMGFVKLFDRGTGAMFQRSEQRLSPKKRGRPKKNAANHK